jgi:mannose-P-dolichol utilization defect protein 1
MTPNHMLPGSCVLQMGCAAAIIALVALRMNRIDVNVDYKAIESMAAGSNTTTAPVSTTQVCYLGTTANGLNLCFAAYGISGISLLATLALSILLCCTCNLCGLGFILETAFAAVGTAAWALAGVVLYQNEERNASLPRADLRRVIFILTWTACALFGLMFLANLWNMFSACCGCCGGSRGGRRGAKARSSAYDMEAPLGKPVVQQQFVVADTSGYRY